MARPVLFMLFNALLYCLILLTISNLLSSDDSPKSFFSTPEPVSKIQKLHYSTITHSSSHSFYINLEETDLPTDLFQKPGLAEVLVESTVFSTSILSFQIENSNFFYINSRILIVPSKYNPDPQENCIIDNFQGILEPGSKKVLGPLQCKFSRNGKFSYTAYIISSGQIFDIVNIKFIISGPQFEITPIPSSTNKFQIKNVGDSSISVTRILFSDFSCHDQNLRIVECYYSFELLPEKYNMIEIKASSDGSTKVKNKYILIQTAFGEISAELLIHYPTTLSEPSLTLNFLSFALMLACVYRQFSSTLMKKIVSSKKQVKIQEFTFRKYYKPSFRHYKQVQTSTFQAFCKKCNSLDEFTMTSETNDTHLNSPTNSLNSEEPSQEDDYFLDSYKTSGLFCRNSFNRDFNHLN